MASPSVLGELELTEEVTRGRVLYTFQGDVPDFFYRLRTPPLLWPFMVLPGVTAEEFRAYAATRGVTVTHPPGARYLCLVVLAMGWTWAPYLAHTCLEEELETVSDEWQARARARDRHPAPSFREVDLIHWAFMDDHLGALLRFEGPEGETEAGAKADAVIDAFRRDGLPVHKEQRGVGADATIGVCLDGRAMQLVPVPGKMAELMEATAHVCRTRRATAEEIRRLVGRWSWNLLVVRLLYSVFSATYRFVMANLEKGVVTIWENAVEELSAAVALGPLIAVDLAAVLSENVYQTDASLEGFGVVSGTFPEEEVRAELRAFGRIPQTHRNPRSDCLLYTSPSPRDGLLSRMPSSA